MIAGIKNVLIVDERLTENLQQRHQLAACWSRNRMFVKISTVLEILGLFENVNLTATSTEQLFSTEQCV